MAPDDTTDDDPWLTLAEIAEELRMSPATVRSWVAKGTLEATRAGQRKWLVRRSEVDRLLGRGPAGQTAVRRPFNTLTPPGALPGEDPGVVVDPVDWLGMAEFEWQAALSQSEMAAPDQWFAERLQGIAAAAARKALALRDLEQSIYSRPSRKPISDRLSLSYELRPGANRPGPADLWGDFDRWVLELRAAEQAEVIDSECRALEALSIVLNDIADALPSYRGNSGQWVELPPAAAESSDD